MEITFKKIAKGSLFRLLAIGFFTGFFVVFTLFGVGALFGFDTVNWNDSQVYGVSGLFVSWAIWFVFSLFFTVYNWLICLLGLWLYSLQKTLTLTFKEANQQPTAD